MSKREVARVASEIQQVAWGVCVAAGQGVARLGKPLAVFLIALLVQASAFGQQSTQTFFFEGDVFQTYTASASGWYFLDVSGAQGGPAGSGKGGLGARMQGYVHLQAGETLRIAVGGAGQVGQWKGKNPSGGGGGGGSSVVNGTTPLLIAGGGGGAGSRENGSGGLATNDGGSGGGAGGAGGTAGSGGAIGSARRGGAGGAGYYGDGGTHYGSGGSPLLSYGGQAYLSGNYGGNGLPTSTAAIGGAGGWGGGGQGGPADSNTDGGGGGGGGYSGGGGADTRNGGGGGGSFVASALNTTGCLALAGANSGNGVVTVQHLAFSATQPVDQTFGFQGSMFQSFTAPATGYYLITALGASGGSVDTNSGGKGAQMQGYFLLRVGQVLRIAAGGVGQDGQYGSASHPTLWTGGGGGGASSVIAADGSVSTPLLIAGGGGGAGIDGNGEDASLSGSGTTSPNGGAGGANGSGGAAGDQVLANNYTTAAGGAGYHTDGGSNSYAIGGQAYLSGNYGGSGGQGETPPNGGAGNGGWGGGGGAALNTSRSDPDGTLTIDHYDGSGGGGGGYSGGGGGGDNFSAYGGGGGGSSSAAACAGSNLSGANTGNGSVSISGPNVATDVVNASGSAYTWPANGITYQNAGTYYYADISNCVVRVLDLSFNDPGGCESYENVEADVVSCGGFTWPPTGRTFTENTTDSFRESCTVYSIELIVAPPTTALAPDNPLAVIESSPDHATGDFVACRNGTQTFTMSAVPYATSYNWLLPPEASGSSTGNSIDVSFDRWFDGGPICVTPANDCGDGDTVCRNIAVANHPPVGRLIVTGPNAPHVSGTYSVTPIEGATDYTWSVSHDQAVIVSGQGTPAIQLEALPGFTHANLTVVASNCEGDGARITQPLGSPRRQPAPRSPSVRSVKPQPSTNAESVSVRD